MNNTLVAFYHARVWGFGSRIWVIAWGYRSGVGVRGFWAGLAQDLLSPEGRLEALQGMGQDDELRLRTWIRAQADGKLAEFRINESLRRAVLRMPRPPRHTYKPGDLMAF